MDKVRLKHNECATIARDVREALRLNQAVTRDLEKREASAMKVILKVSVWKSEDRLITQDDFRRIRNSLGKAKDFCNVHNYTDSFHHWLAVFEAFLNLWAVASKRRV